jgi:hypothetical protein
MTMTAHQTGKYEFKGFELYVGSTKTFEQDGGVVFTVTAEYDIGLKPTDWEDCYSDDDIQRWHDDEWCFLWLRLAVCVEGVELATESLGGIESFADDDCVSDMLDGMAVEAMEQAAQTLTKLKKIELS